MGQGTEHDGARRAGGAGDEEEFAGGGSHAAAPAKRAGLDYGRVWRVVAFALVAAAAALVFLGHNGAAFFVAGLGASAWFLNVRATLIRKHDLVKVGGRNWRPRREVERESEAEEEGGED